ncbi:MAG: DUF3887 domain-containing protein [Acidobacteria bacterium]|nr:DUF3887 domain-containing protein [Acidobacteriota bacterium]
MKRLHVLALILAITAATFAIAGSHDVPNLQGRARQLVTDLASGRMNAVVAEFDARMRTALPAAKLSQVWDQIQDQAGKFEAIGTVRHVQAGAYDIILVGCTFARAQLDAKIVYDRKGRVAGFFFLPAQPVAPARKETPPSGVRERAVTVGHAPWTLPATLSLPKGPGPFPAVVLVAGSGPQDRDETIGPNKIFRDLAWGLASKGIAVLRYEKRTKRYPVACAKLHDFTLKEETIDDARAAVDLLSRTPQIDHRRVFVLGHSLGGMAAPRIAAGDPHVAGLIIMAGNVRPLEDLMVSQVLYLARLDGKLSAQEKRQIAAVRALRAKVEGPALAANDTVDVLGSRTPGSYWLDLRGYHPDTVAATLHIPMLILQGGRDYQVTRADFRLWKRALEGHTNVTFKLYPSLDHLFIPGRGPSSPAEYMKPGHVDPRVITDIAAWIRTQPGRHK